jgi:hypothetical protein
MLASSQMIGTRGGGPGMAHYGASHTLAHQHHLYSVQPNARCDAPSRSNPLPARPLLRHRRLAAAGCLPILFVSRLRLSLPCPCLFGRPGPGLQASSGVWAPPLRPPGASGHRAVPHCAGTRLRPGDPNGERRVPVALALTPSWLARLCPSDSPHRHRPPAVVGM